MVVAVPIGAGRTSNNCLIAATRPLWHPAFTGRSARRRENPTNVSFFWDHASGRPNFPAT